MELEKPLEDKIANTIGEMKDAIFANGFGRITDLEIGPDGYMYLYYSVFKVNIELIDIDARLTI